MVTAYPIEDMTEYPSSSRGQTFKCILQRGRNFFDTASAGKLHPPPPHTHTHTHTHTHIEKMIRPLILTFSRKNCVKKTCGDSRKTNKLSLRISDSETNIKKVPESFEMFQYLSSVVQNFDPTKNCCCLTFISKKFGKQTYWAFFLPNSDFGQNIYFVRYYNTANQGYLELYDF